MLKFGRILFAASAFIVLAGAALAQPSPNPGPTPPPSPWTYAAPLIYPPAGSCIAMPQTVTGGCPGGGNSINIGGGYYLNGVLLVTIATVSAPLHFSAGTLSLNIDSSLAVNGGNLGINLAHSNIFSAPQTVDFGSGSAPTIDAGVGFAAFAANGNTARFEAISFGTVATFTGTMSLGTRASPTPPISGTLMAQFNAHGYDTSVWTGIGSSLRLYGEGTWSATSHPGAACLGAVLSGTTSLVDSLCVHNDGGVTVSASGLAATSMGAGTLNLSGNLFKNGVAPATTINSTSCPLYGSCTITVAASLVVGSTTISGGTPGDIEFNNGGVLGELGTTGSGVVALANSPTFVSQITAPQIFGGTSAGATVSIQSTSNGSPSADSIALRSSQIVLRNIGSGLSLVQIGIAGTTQGEIQLASPTANAMNLVSATSANGTATFPNGTYNIVGDTVSQTLTNKTISGSSNTLSNIANASLTNSTISGVALGGNLLTLTFGPHLSASGSSYNGSTATTIQSDAASANTASTIVARDGSGNFAAGTITASLTGHASLDLALTGGSLSSTLTAADGGTWGAGGISDGVIAATTSLAVGGCAIGTNALCVTGTNFFQIPSPSGTVSNFIVSGNATTPANVAHPNSIQIVAADNNFADFYIDSFGSAGSAGGQSYRSVITLRSARGTNASRSGMLAGDEFARFSGRGYGATGFSSTIIAISGIAAQNLTDTAQGTFLAFRTTALNVAGGGNIDVPPVVGAFAPSGSLIVGGLQVAASFTGSISGTALTVSSGTGIVIGQVILGAGVLPNTFITAGSGTSWTVSLSQTVGSEAMTSNNFFATQTANDLGSGVISAQVGLAVFGAASGDSLIQAPATGGGTLTLPAGTDTLAGLAAAQTLTNKTITFASNTLTGVAPLASPSFTGTITGPDSGTWGSGGINGSAVGGTTRAAGAFTTLAANSTANFTGAFQINGNAITWPAAAISVARIDAAQTFNGNQTFQAAGASSTLASVSINTSTTTSGAQSVIESNDNNSGQTNLAIINSAGANTTLINIPAATVLRAIGSAASLYIGTSSASSGPVVLFQGGTAVATNIAINIVAPTDVRLPHIAADTGLTDTSVCQDTTNHTLFSGTSTAGTCLGNVSSIRFKRDWRDIADGLGVIDALDPGTYRYNAGIADGGTQLRVGFTAERYAEVLPQFTRYDEEGKPNGLDMLAAFPYAVRAIQQLDDQVKELRAANDDLRAEVGRLRAGGGL